MTRTEFLRGKIVWVVIIFFLFLFALFSMSTSAYFSVFWRLLLLRKGTVGLLLLLDMLLVMVLLLHVELMLVLVFLL